MLLIIPIRLNTLLVLKILTVNLAMPNANSLSVIMSEMPTKVPFSLKDPNLNGIENYLVNEVLKTQPPTYRIEDINGEIIEGKYYELELLKSEFDFESKNKVLESLGIFLSVNK